MLKKSDLANMIKRKDYGGFGYLTHEIRDESVDEAVLSALNEINCDEDQAFLFLNSRVARFMADEVLTAPDKAQKICERYLNRYLPDLIEESKKRN